MPPNPVLQLVRYVRIIARLAGTDVHVGSGHGHAGLDDALVMIFWAPATPCRTRVFSISNDDWPSIFLSYADFSSRFRIRLGT